MAIVSEEVETFAGRHRIDRQDRTGEVLAIICRCKNCGKQWDDGEEGIDRWKRGWVPWICKRCTEELNLFP